MTIRPIDTVILIDALKHLSLLKDTYENNIWVYRKESRLPDDCIALVFIRQCKHCRWFLTEVIK